ncbi:MAG: AgmX/PglI C-terminal domain-containing protein [Pseudobdellovibrionaceae bacterium]
MKSPVILRVFKGNQLVEVKQFDLDQIVIGHNADVGLDLNSEEVSAIHCLIELRDAGYYICDLGSATGTFKNGQPILDEALASGDEIGIGPFKINFFIGIPKPKAAPPGQVVIPAEPAIVVPPPPEIDSISSPAIPVAIPQSVVPSVPSTSPVFETPKVETPKVERKPQIATAPIVVPVGKTEIPSLKKSSFSKKGKNKKTFAPASEVKDLRDQLRLGRGNVVEVIVSWKERVLTTYHFRTPGIVRLGAEKKFEIHMPEGVCPTGWPLVEVGPETQVAVTSEMKVELLTKEGKKSVDDLLRMGKAQRTGNSVTMKLGQEEIYFIALPYSDLQLYVRFVQQPPLLAVPPWFLSSSELTGMVMSLILVALLALYVYTTAPTMVEEEKKEEIVAQVVFDKPKPTPPPVKVVEEKPVESPTPAPPKPTPTPKKVQLADKQVEMTNKAKKPDPAVASKNSKAGAASEVAPKPNSQHKPKILTSTQQQGGAVKQGKTESANAQSKNKDVSKVGMFAALGGGGMRKNLDKAYSGAGEILGTAANATGTAGSNSDRAGDDIGGKFKDTGAGGKGTATVGIAGVGTKGRGTGYGTGDGLGDKNSVAIEPGGAEEDFVGTIDREAVRRVIKAGLREIRGCYERELNKLNKTQHLEGKVIIEWTIADHGRALNAKVKSSTLGNRAVENCVRDRLASWKFPDPPAGTVAEVNYPFYFRAEN